MSAHRHPLPAPLPADAAPAVEIVRRLRAAGHEALLAGGCVRDLLLGLMPSDYDVATDAAPQAVGRIFRATRAVGAQFGVVLVRSAGRWVEVATFRRDAAYLDGRRPVSVQYTDAREDALRRDFTINGMFLDPLPGPPPAAQAAEPPPPSAPQVIDYVGGRADLRARGIRAIGDPHARFAEDHLRLLRAVRFAARFDFTIEPDTLAAIRTHATTLPRVAAERRRDELERMLAHASRARAFALLRETGLLTQLWEGAAWSASQLERVAIMLPRLPADAGFELGMAVLLADRTPAEIERVARELACSNQQRATILWLLAQQAALDDPDHPPLAQLKRLIADPAFGALQALAAARWLDQPDPERARRACAARLAAIDPRQIQPEPLVRGPDLAERGVPPGPIYKRVLDELYERQLNETLADRAAALAALDALLAGRTEYRITNSE